jgi:hypothetical protein
MEGKLLGFISAASGWDKKAMTMIRKYSFVLNGFISPPFLLMLSLLLSSGVSAQPVDGQGHLTQSPSIVEIPIRLSLDRLFQVAELEMPLQAGHWRDWKKTYGIKTKYRAWRGPLSFTMQGETLLVQAHVRYWIKARKKVLGALNLKSSCGVNEPPRQAVIGVQIRLGWGPDWLLRPDFRVMPARFFDRCEMTIADIDVTPLIAKEFQKQLKEKMRSALMTLGPRLNAIRQQAEQNWLLLQEPVPLWADHWLLLNPRGVALSPLTGHGDSVEAHLAVLMVPNMVTGSEPASQHWPLPPLMQFYRYSTGLNLQLAVDLNTADLNRTMTEQLSGESIDIGGHQAGIEAIELGGQGQEIRVNATLSGDAAGNVMIKANIIFTPETQQFQLENLNYTYTPEDPLLELRVSLFYGYIRKVLEAAANEQLQQRMKQWKEQLLTVFDKITPDDVKLDMTSLQLSQVQFSVAEGTIRLNGLASGYIRFDFR